MEGLHGEQHKKVNNNRGGPKATLLLGGAQEYEKNTNSVHLLGEGHKRNWSTIIWETFWSYWCGKKWTTHVCEEDSQRTLIMIKNRESQWGGSKNIHGGSFQG